MDLEHLGRGERSELIESSDAACGKLTPCDLAERGRKLRFAFHVDKLSAGDDDVQTRSLSVPCPNRGPVRAVGSTPEWGVAPEPASTVVGELIAPRHVQ